MKYIFTVLLAIVLFSAQQAYGACSIDFEGSDPVAGMVGDCLEQNETLVVRTDGKNLNAGAGTNRIINDFIGRLGAILGVIAVLMIVYSGFLMTLSGGDEEKIKKGKDLFKWTVIGFIALVSAGGIISLIISTVYDFSRL